MTVRVRFADLRSVTRALTLPAPICATAALADVAIDLVRGVLADHPGERTISLLAISASNLGEDPFRSSNCRSASPTTADGRARARAWRGCGPIAPSTRSASASEETRWIMGQHRGMAAPSLTSFDALLKESFDYLTTPAATPSVRTRRFTLCHNTSTIPLQLGSRKRR